MDLSIIILNYKTKGLLKQCLKGLLAVTITPSFEIIVVDNDSKDGTGTMMQAEFPQVRFIQSPVNGGFAYGVNLGIREAGGRFILVMNADVAVLGNTIDQMFTYMEQHPEVGIAGPKLLNPDGTVQTSCRQFQTPAIILYRRSPLGKLGFARRRLRKFLMLDWDHKQNAPVDWILGACMMVNREAMQKVGLLDERFFLYFEDMDWCRRFWAAGYTVMYLGATAELVHYHGRQSAESPGLSGVFSYATRVHIRSALQYFLKYARSPLPKRTHALAKEHATS